ncbi:MAG: ABC transporter ATP-binding protein [Firmicutes bacterium]|nr:ABC transporter ATP-binding protein [Bacillota bacterium]MDY5856123.1 ABC transporter ATP-binding protein [Anaerovoracaceae bacterium]
MEKKRDYHKPILSIFLSYFGPHKKLFLLDMSCAFLVAAIDVAFPLVSRYCMYELLPEKIYTTFFVLMAVAAAAFAVRAVLHYVITYLGHTFGIRVEADIRNDLYRHYQELEFDFFDQNRTGKLMNRLTGDLFEITELAHHGPEDLLISFVTIAGALAVMFRVEWRLALVVLIIIPVFIAVIMFCRRAMMTASAQVKQKMADINADIESTISGMKTSKAFDNQEVDYARFDRSNKKFRGSKEEFYKAMGRFNASLEFFICILQVAVIAFGGYLIMGDRLNYIDLLTFTMYITTFVNPVRKLANFAELFISGFAGLRRFVEIMCIEPSVQDAPDAETLTDVKGHICMDHVSFGYKEGVDVLRNVSLDIAPGECIAVVGHSGGGKSTLCQLIPRFYDVDAGSISIDGRDVRHVTKSSLRSSIGIVQQDVFLFADTILENIRYGRPDATFAEVEEAAKRARIYDDICAMPDGFDTYVGERGTLLSGGQKQRISIARIFLKNPSILILDEATSALDSITEEEIRQSFTELSRGRTTIMIAHRLATIKDADRIVLIEDGQIREEGTHQELIALHGEYAELYRTQSLTTVPETTGDTERKQ